VNPSLRQVALRKGQRSRDSLGLLGARICGLGGGVDIEGIECDTLIPRCLVRADFRFLKPRGLGKALLRDHCGGRIALDDRDVPLVGGRRFLLTRADVHGGLIMVQLKLGRAIGL